MRKKHEIRNTVFVVIIKCILRKQLSTKILMDCFLGKLP